MGAGEHARAHRTKDAASRKEEPVPVTITNPQVNYTNTLRFIAVMTTAIFLILILQGFDSWV